MTSLAVAHQRVCDAVDLARDHAADDVLAQLRSATIHLWYALHSSADPQARLDAAEAELTTALDAADTEVAAPLRTALDHLRGCTGGVA